MNCRELKERVSIELVLDTYGRLANLRCVGNRLKGPCPLHDQADNTNAFVVDRNRNLWFCFTRCNRGGDVIELVRTLERCSFKEALVLLHRLAGKSNQVNSLPQKRPENASHGRCTTETRTQFQPFARKLVLTTNHLRFRKMGLTKDTLDHFEAGYYPYPQGFLKHCLAVRLHDPDGNPLGYAGRRLKPWDIARYGKWNIPRGLPKATMLYNWHRARQHDKQPLIITEGPWAVMKLSQAGYPGAVALLGVRLSEAQRQLISTSLSLHICLLLDGDKVGRQAAPRMKAQLGHKAMTIDLPQNVDPDDLQEEDLKKIISAYVPK